MKLTQTFQSKKEYGLLFLRLVIGYRLIVAVWSSVISWQQILGVKDFFQQSNIPLPLTSAVVAVYAEFICGLLFIIGLWIRQAALVMILTFIVAIIFVDIHNTFKLAFPAWAILASSVAFLFYGAGGFSVDKWLGKSNKRESIA